MGSEDRALAHITNIADLAGKKLQVKLYIYNGFGCFHRLIEGTFLDSITGGGQGMWKRLYLSLKNPSVVEQSCAFHNIYGLLSQVCEKFNYATDERWVKVYSDYASIEKIDSTPIKSIFGLDYRKWPTWAKNVHFKPRVWEKLYGLTKSFGKNETDGQGVCDSEVMSAAYYLIRKTTDEEDMFSLYVRLVNMENHSVADKKFSLIKGLMQI